MSEMLTDLLQNIYGRIAQLGKSIQQLQHSIEELNKSLVEKVDSLVVSIKSMTDSVEKEADTEALIFHQIGDEAIREIHKLQEHIGLKDFEKLLDNLNKIVTSSEEALKPEIVDLLLKEVLDGVRSLKMGEPSEQSQDTNDQSGKTK
jgi:predicted  nucleic acid-binding Zn-ribbon protein